MMELKEYQRGALDALACWLETLEETQRELETMIEMFRQAPTRQTALFHIAALKYRRVAVKRDSTAACPTPKSVPKSGNLPTRGPP